MKRLVAKEYVQEDSWWRGLYVVEAEVEVVRGRKGYL